MQDRLVLVVQCEVEEVSVCRTHRVVIHETGVSVR